MTIQQLINKSSEQLKTIAGDLARKEAQILLCHLLNISRSDLVTNPKMELNKEELARFNQLIKRRQAAEPIAKIIGYKEFWSLPFKVTKDTLDPRPDTETLIEAVLSLCDDKDKPYRILDLGTGTGCIVLALLHELKNAKGVAVDASEAALAVAQENAINLGLENRIEFVQSDWGTKIDQSYDIIVSNPPYISERDYLKLSSAVRLYDPRQALVSGVTGLEDYKKIAYVIKKHLAWDGFFAIEIGINQEQSVQSILEEHGLIILDIWKDLANIPRCIVGRRVS